MGGKVIIKKRLNANAEVIANETLKIIEVHKKQITDITEKMP